MQIQAAIVLVVIFFFMLAMSVPISFSIIASALITIIMFLNPQFGMFISAQKMASGIDSFSMLAVPFFILAGQLMSSGGIARKLINLAMLILGKVPGSLALTNIAGNAMFGSLSGSGIAAATAIGGVMNPLEKEEGYDPGFSAATNIAGRTADPSDKLIHCIFRSKRRSFRCNTVHGRMDPGTSLGILLYGSSFLLCKEKRLCGKKN